MVKCDFYGWATKNDVRCADGRIIKRDCFIDNDGETVPLMWNHQHNDVHNVLGHALLKNEPEGVRVYGTFNDTESGQAGKALVGNGDIVALSIYANQLKHNGCEVVHGNIREVSLVVAGANPEAYIESIIKHGEECEEEAIIYSDVQDISLCHAENSKTVKEVFDGFTEEEKKVVYALIGQAIEDIEDGDDDMKHNLFDSETYEKKDVISHAEQGEILGEASANRVTSLKKTVLAHGITDVEYLFPDPKALNNVPQFIERDMGWVSRVMSGVSKSPFSRIKSIFADITEDEARARGYIKGDMKVDEVFSLLQRTTDPQTVYKKQMMDRDDVIDITSFDVVGFIKSEMRKMLDEEIARAILVGDGRLASSREHIKEDHIRPIWKDDELYTIKARFDKSQGETAADDNARNFIRTIIKARKNYKGSGDPILLTTEDMVTDCLLLEDKMGRDIYDSMEKLRTKLRVKDIVTVPVMENLTRQDGGSTYTLLGIIVNLKDYNVGADKGGSVNMFDDFDIDYNAMKFLMETRCSGALTKPYSAIAVEMKNPA